MITNQSQNIMNNSINGGMVTGINNNLTLTNQSPNINSSNTIQTTSNQGNSNGSNPSVMTYNPTYNKCLPKILSDLDCEMRVKQVLKCVESMLAEGADEASMNAHAVPHSNSPNAPGFSSFKLSSNSQNINGNNSNSNNIISDRQVPGTSTPQKKLKRSDYSETTPKLLENQQSTQSTPNISSLSNQHSSPRKSGNNSSANGSSSPKNKIKINIAGDQRQSNNNSPVQGQPSNNSPLIKQNNLEIIDKKQIGSNSVQQSPLIAQQIIQQQQIDDQRRSYQNFYSPQLGMVNQMLNQQGQVISIQGTPVMNPQQQQQNNMQSPPMMPFSIEDPRRMMYAQYDQNMMIQNDPSRRHSFAPYGVNQMDPNGIIDQQRRMSYSTFESQQQQQHQQSMMQQIHIAQLYQQQQQQHQQHQQQQQFQQQIQHQKQKSPTLGNVNSKQNEQQQQYIDQQNITECKKEDKIEHIQQSQTQPQENRNQQQFCLSTPTLSAYPVNSTGAPPVNNEEDSWILSFFSEDAQDNPDQQQLKSNQG